MYLAPFKTIKAHLKRVYLDTSKLAPAIDKIDTIEKIAIKHDENSVVPYMYVVGNIGYININKSLVIEPKEHKEGLVHVGYKRADDLLDLNGKPLHKSKRMAFVLFKLKYKALLPRIYKFIKFLFTK
jgi:hypothetical protein